MDQLFPELALPRADIGAVDPRNDAILQLGQFLTHLGQQRPILKLTYIPIRPDTSPVAGIRI